MLCALNNRRGLPSATIRCIKKDIKMNTIELEVLQKLDKSDQEKVIYFLKLLLNQAKYKKLKDEILSRKDEIKYGEIFEHEEIWKELDV